MFARYLKGSSTKNLPVILQLAVAAQIDRSCDIHFIHLAARDFAERSSARCALGTSEEAAPVDKLCVNLTTRPKAGLASLLSCGVSSQFPSGRRRVSDVTRAKCPLR